MDIIDLKVEHLIEGLSVFKKSRYGTVMELFHKNMPAMECHRCGKCCEVPPRMTYAELLNSMSHLVRSIDREEFANFLRECVRQFFTEMIESTMCPLFDKKNGCRIYSAAPVSCRTFGFSASHEFSVQCDHEMNRAMNKIYAQYGLLIPDSIALKRTDCSIVHTIDGVSASKINEIADAFTVFKLLPLNMVLKGPEEEVPIFTWVALMLLEGRVTMEFKIRVSKSVQDGSTEFLDMVLSAIDYYRFADRIRDAVIKDSE